MERAASDLRRGTPVILIQENGKQLLVGAGEYGAEGTEIRDKDHPAVTLMKIAGLLPVAVMMENSPFSDVLKVQETAIMHYKEALSTSLIKVSEAAVPLQQAENARIIAFRPRFGHDEHLAILIGKPQQQKAPLVRLHSSCITGDILGSLRCDCGSQLQKAIATISTEKHGVILYLNQEGRGIGIANKLRAYRLQDSGMDTVEANEALGFEADERDFAIAAQMLKMLGIKNITLMTNNPHKMKILAEQGVEVLERRSLMTEVNAYNAHYMDTKMKKLGHHLEL